MKDLFEQIKIQVNDRIYVKDPNASELGRSIIKTGILMIDDLGLERFTFKKLATELGTAESSIYRYFESKRMLLMYLTSWYWGWLEYQLVFATANISSPHDRLSAAIRVLCQDMSGKDVMGYIDLDHLNRIVISESSKAYLVKDVSTANKEGFFSGYKRLVNRIHEIIQEINPHFKYGHMLVSTIVEGIHHQKYFAEHIPSLTDKVSENGDLASFFSNLALSTIISYKS